MGLTAVTEVVKLLGDSRPTLTDEDKEYILQFAFRTSDMELTSKLIDELCAPKKDSLAIYQKFQTMVDTKPEWISQIEDLLIALERYRVEEERAIKALTEVLAAYGVEVSEEEIKNVEVGEMKTWFKKEASL